MANLFQFVDVPRQDPQKLPVEVRSQQFQRDLRPVRRAVGGRPVGALYLLRQPLLRVEVPGSQLHPQLAETGRRGQPLRGGGSLPRDQFAARDLRPHLPAGPALRGRLHAERRFRRRHHRLGREVHHRHRPRTRLAPGPVAREGHAASAWPSSVPDRPASVRRHPGAQRRQTGGVRPLSGDRRPAHLRHSAVQAGKGGDGSPAANPGGDGRRVPAQHRDRARRALRTAAGRVRRRVSRHGHLHGDERRLSRREPARRRPGAAVPDLQRQPRTGPGEAIAASSST